LISGAIGHHNGHEVIIWVGLGFHRDVLRAALLKAARPYVVALKLCEGRG
jgi:hypothetical protein